MIIERCESCGEQVLKINGIKQHRFNLSLICPNGKTMLPLAQRSVSPFEAPFQTFMDEMDEVKAETETETETEAESDSDKEQESDSDKEQESEADAEEDMKKQDAKPSKGKGKGKPSSSSDPQDGEDKSDSQPPPPPTSDDWALPAAQEINRLWEERIQNRDYKPTDEELAQRLLQHSKGKVNYQPFAPSAPTTTRLRKPGTLAGVLYDIKVRRGRTIRQCSEFCFVCNAPIANGAHAWDDSRLCGLGAVLSGGSPPPNVERGKPYVYRPWQAEEYKYSSIDFEPCSTCGDDLYSDNDRPNSVSPRHRQHRLQGVTTWRWRQRFTSTTNSWNASRRR